MSSFYEDEVLKGEYKKAFYRSANGYVDPKRDIDLDRAIRGYIFSNKCTYDEAFIFAKAGRKMGSLKDGGEKDV